MLDKGGVKSKSSLYVIYLKAICHLLMKAQTSQTESRIVDDELRLLLVRNRSNGFCY